MKKIITALAGLCLFVGACQSEERVLDASAIYLGLQEIPVRPGDPPSCSMLASQQPGLGLALAANAGGQLIGAQLVDAASADCRFTARATAQALVALQLGALSGTAAQRAAAVNTARSIDVGPLAAQLSEGMPLDQLLRSPGWQSTWQSTLSTVRIAAPAGCDFLGGPLLPKMDLQGDDGVGFRGRRDGDKVTLTANDCGSLDAVKGILVNQQAPATYIAPQSDSPLVTFLERFLWKQNHTDLTLGLSSSPTTLSVVAPATVTGIWRGAFDSSRSGAEMVAQGNATLLSFSHVIYVLLNDVFIERYIGDSLDQLVTTDCETAISAMVSAIKVKWNLDANRLSAEFSVFDLMKSIAEYLLIEEPTMAPNSVWYQCFQKLPSFRAAKWESVRAALEKIKVFADAASTFKGASKAVLGLATGYPYLRHTLVTCPECASGPPSCVVDRDCASDQSCVSGTCMTRSCSPNARVCAGSAVQSCNSNGIGWQTVQTCGVSCQGMACCGGDNEPCCTGQATACGAGLVCMRSGICKADTTPTRLNRRFTSACGPYPHWTSTNNTCYPGSSSATQGCGTCAATVINGGCAAATQTCWIREDDQNFRTADSDPGYGSFQRINHCFDGGVNSYTRGSCGVAGDPADLGWIASAPVGRYTVPVAICERSAGAAREQLFSVKVKAECIDKGLTVVSNPFGYVAQP